jgi:hypothetical protein
MYIRMGNRIKINGICAKGHMCSLFEEIPKSKKPLIFCKMAALRKCGFPRGKRCTEIQVCAPLWEIQQSKHVLPDGGSVYVLGRCTEGQLCISLLENKQITRP